MKRFFDFLVLVYFLVVVLGGIDLYRNINVPPYHTVEGMEKYAWSSITQLQNALSDNVLDYSEMLPSNQGGAGCFDFFISIEEEKSEGIFEYVRNIKEAYHKLYYYASTSAEEWKKTEKTIHKNDHAIWVREFDNYDVLMNPILSPQEKKYFLFLVDGFKSSLQKFSETEKYAFYNGMAIRKNIENPPESSDAWWLFLFVGFIFSLICLPITAYMEKKSTEIIAGLIGLVLLVIIWGAIRGNIF